MVNTIIDSNNDLEHLLKTINIMMKRINSIANNAYDNPHSRGHALEAIKTLTSDFLDKQNG